jgi:putative lipoic acid-binding regulatory protein
MREIDFSDAQKDGKGFQFPGEFEITAIGSATAGLDKHVPALLQGIGLEVLHETLSTKLIPAGNYLSITVSFVAPRIVDDAGFVTSSYSPDSCGPRPMRRE